MRKLNIRLSAKSGASKSHQIADQMATAIVAGKLAAGVRLPSERALAAQLGVDRKTVRRAYDALTIAERIESLGTLGRRVRARAKR